jgi:hypothetical protein
MSIHHRPTVRDLVQSYLNELPHAVDKQAKAQIMFTRQMSEGYLVVYMTEDNESRMQRDYVAFFTVSTVDAWTSQVHCEWDHLCSAE